MSKSESGQVWLVLGEQREGLGWKRASEAPPAGVCQSLCQARAI